MMSNHVRVGASIPEGVDALEVFVKLKLGNLVLTKLPLDKNEAFAVARYCRNHKIYFIFSELLWRGTFDLCWSARRKMPRSEFYSKKELEEIFEAGGEYFLGRITLGEVGGLLYGPKAYWRNRAVGDWRSLPAVKNMVEAEKVYLDFMRKVINYERNQLGESKLLDGEAGMSFKHHLEAGIDIPLLEMMPGDAAFMCAAIRGASVARRRRMWGVQIAMACYGGVRFDNMWMKRWKTSLYFSFMAGADFIYPECGHFEYNETDKQHTFNSGEMKKSRRILREFNQFTKIHSRPADGPAVNLGFVYGHLDGYPGLWNKYVWGQSKGKKWLHGPAEFGWDLLRTLYRKEQWNNENVQGEKDFYGNPPYGQFDIVPIEAPLDILQKYSCLVFLGWNTMTDEIYRKLKAYVRNGGHLVMSVPHLSTHTDRGADLSLYRDGDWRDLFGVRVKGPGKKGVAGIKTFNHSSLAAYKMPVWRMNTDPRFIGNFTIADSEVKGAKVISGWSDFYRNDEKSLIRNPFLTEKRLGKGVAFLIHSWMYPGDPGTREFMGILLKIISLGEQKDIRLIGSDMVRYAVYRGKFPAGKNSPEKLTVIYVLNTEFDVPQMVRLWMQGKTSPVIEIPPADMCLMYYFHDLLLIFEDRGVDIQSWSVDSSEQRISLFSRRNQKIRIFNLGKRKKMIAVNGAQISCGPNGECAISIRKKVDPEHAEYFASDFLDEPEIKWTPGPLPY